MARQLANMKETLGEIVDVPHKLATYSRTVTFTLDALALAGLLWYCILWSLSIAGFTTARRRYRSRPVAPPPSTPPGVSILRPLKGLDTNLYENLESTFTLNYPNYELLLCVADGGDQALTVVGDLLEKYPRVDARVMIGEEIVGVNPKVNNLMRAYREAKHDILWVIDSNVQVEPGSLTRSVNVLCSNQEPSSIARKRIGVVHHVPCAFATDYQLGSRIEEAFLNTNHAKMYLAINTVAIESCVVGKSNLYRRSDVERVNGSLKPVQTGDMGGTGGVRGLAAFGRFLAEDNMIASALWHELGLAHDLSSDVARNSVGRMSFSSYVWRRVRWVRVRKHMVFAATLVEPLTECVMLSFIASWSLGRLFAVPIWLTLLAHYPLWLWVDFDVRASLSGGPMEPGNRWGFLAAWCVREFMALPIWMVGMVGREVDWRGTTYRVLPNGEATRLSP